ncbi:MAG: T9SS type A sorting domain-containing protein [Bacteroidetes bacterium]|nr:T9SS type A sorting domain-containing protein [Bacteroidota bacterium]
MKHKYLIALIAFYLFSFRVEAQQTPAFRGIYIDSFDDILGNTVKEDSLLQYASDSSFNYLALYDLHTINFSNSTQVNRLASFIRKARETYGISGIGAVGESYSTFANKIAPYNSSRTNANEKFSVFNLEFEFWTASSVNPGGYYCTQYLQPNGCACDSSGGFKFFIENMHKIDSLATVQGATSETYLGWFNQGQGSQIQRNVNRILLHAYRVDPSSVYGYSKTRLQYLASNNTTVNVAPIFSSEPNFMGPWLDSHSQIEAFNKYKADFQADNSSSVQYINLLGYQWFDYGYMPKPIPGSGNTSFTATINASGATSFCAGESVTITAGGGTSYLWSNNAITSSITVNTSGTYSCQVTKNGVTQTTSTVSVVVNSLPTVTISQGALNNNSITVTSIAEPSTGTLTGYQWKLNNSTISGATSADYIATATGDYKVEVTNSAGCSATSAIENVVIPTQPSCIITTPVGLVSSAENPTSQRLKWDALSTSDSIVIRYKPENSSNYSYIRMLNVGQTNLILTGLLPNTKYQWRLKTVCGATSGSYSVKKQFTTIGNTAIFTPSQTAMKTMGIEEIEEEDLMIYPNPARENISIKFFSLQETESTIQFLDINGRIIKLINTIVIDGDNEISIDTQELSNGIYFLKVITPLQNETKRLIVEK